MIFGWASRWAPAFPGSQGEHQARQAHANQIRGARPVNPSVMLGGTAPRVVRLLNGPEDPFQALSFSA
jgi:hypothetical protein